MSLRTIGFFLRVDPGGVEVTLREIIEILFDRSWISRFDEAYTRASFLQRIEPTVADMKDKLLATDSNSISQDAGEYVVSELARGAIIQQMRY